MVVKFDVTPGAKKLRYATVCVCTPVWKESYNSTSLENNLRCRKRKSFWWSLKCAN